MEVKELYFSIEVEEKLWKKHQLTPRKVRKAARRSDVEIRFERHPRHGYRALARTIDEDGFEIVIWLTPINIEEGTWSVITAYTIKR